MGRSPGRNQPCPCGSGKKYKRCCQGSKLGGLLAQELAPPASWPLHRYPFSPGAVAAIACDKTTAAMGEIHPWVRAHLTAKYLELAPGSLPAPPLSLTEVRLESTKELFRRLEKHGPPVSESAFRRGAARHISAWELSTSWTGSRALDKPSRTEVGLVTCELWRRLCPDTPSLEMLDEAMQKGFDFADDGELPCAVAVWLRFWDDLLRTLPPDLHSIEQVDEHFIGLNPVGSWLFDFRTVLHNAALEDPDTARRGLAWCHGFLRRFPEGEDASTVRRLEAELCFYIGDTARAEELLRAMIAENPDDVVAYETLAVLFGMSNWPERTNLEGAIAVLEEGLARPALRGDESLRGLLAELSGKPVPRRRRRR